MSTSQMNAKRSVQWKSRVRGYQVPPPPRNPTPPMSRSRRETMEENDHDEATTTGVKLVPVTPMKHGEESSAQTMAVAATYSMHDYADTFRGLLDRVQSGLGLLHHSTENLHELIVLDSHNVCSMFLWDWCCGFCSVRVSGPDSPRGRSHTDDGMDAEDVVAPADNMLSWMGWQSSTVRVISPRSRSQYQPMLGNNHGYTSVGSGHSTSL